MSTFLAINGYFYNIQENCQKKRVKGKAHHNAALRNLINQGKNAHSNTATFPPISHQSVMFLCKMYDAGLTCTKMQITDFHSATFRHFVQVTAALGNRLKYLRP